MNYFTTSEINLYFTYNSAKRTLTLKDIKDFICIWHCVKQPYCILTFSNSWHERFCFVLYLWEGRNKRYKATKNRKILMTTEPPSGLFEYTRRPIFVSVSVHMHEHYQVGQFVYKLVREARLDWAHSTRYNLQSKMLNFLQSPKNTRQFSKPAPTFCFLDHLTTMVHLHSTE
jgi:hypothetical protein